MSRGSDRALHPLNSQKAGSNTCATSVTPVGSPGKVVRHLKGQDRQQTAVAIAPRTGLAPSRSGDENGTLTMGSPGSAPRL